MIFIMSIILKNKYLCCWKEKKISFFKEKGKKDKNEDQEQKLRRSKLYGKDKSWMIVLKSLMEKKKEREIFIIRSDVN